MQMNYPYANAYPYQPSMPPYNGMNAPVQPVFPSSQYNYTPMQNNALNGANTAVRIVDNIDVVKAADIPMDGNTYYFPKGDGTAVYAKRWLSNGDAPVITFLPQKQEEQPSPIDSASEAVNAKFDVLSNTLNSMQEKLDSLYGKIEELYAKPKNTPNRAKAE